MLLRLRLRPGLRRAGLLRVWLRRATVALGLRHRLTLGLLTRPRGVLRHRLLAGPRLRRGLRVGLRRLSARPLRLRRTLRVLPRRMRGTARLRPGILRLRRLLRGRPRNVERIGRVGPGIIAGGKAIVACLGRRHHRHVGHLFRLQLDDAGFELRVDAPQQRSHIKIEQRAIGIHHATRLGPRRQCIERTLLERLHHVGSRSESRGEIGFGKRGRGP